MARTATTPMMRQYEELKEAHPDALLLFRCGDFYELYGSDAEEGGRLLNIVVTRKAAGADGFVAMAGVPFHAIEAYLAKLVRAGRRVAIAEQTEDPATAKGLVRREVVRVVTPGTAIDEGLVEDGQNSYLVALVSAHDGWGIAVADVSTGFFALTEFRGSQADEELLAELVRLEPRELLLPEPLEPHALRGWLAERSTSLTRLPERDFDEEHARRVLCDHFRVQSLEGFGASEMTHGVAAAGALLQYLRDTQKSAVPHLTSLQVRFAADRMIIDAVTQRSLELVRNSHGGGREATLLSILDRTLTPMGTRLLRSWLLEPLRRREEIDARLEAVACLCRELSLRGSLAELLRGVRDIERITARASAGSASPRELATLRLALERLPKLRALLLGAPAPLLKQLGAAINELRPLAELLTRALVDEPPANTRDGGVIREGFSPELDELHKARRGGKDFIAQIRQSEAERLGIANLKINYNRVFGYYIELTSAQIRQLPSGIPTDYQRKQTLANCERFVTQELKEKEELVLGAEERAIALEQTLYSQLLRSVADEAAVILANAQALAAADCLLSFAEVSLVQRYTRPALNDEHTLEIIDGRHPVLESIQRDPPFVSNDTMLSGDARQIALITGPNMAGKSTYIRQVALITLMAHIGCFVPAAQANLPLCDRIFTRVGAMDHLAQGQSTFLVEMTELANILRNATANSLIILDEIGRGTSTYDGLSIAWSVCEFLHNTKGTRPLTLFATHYHELTELEGALPRLHNLSVAVDEAGDRIVFLFRIIAGRSNRSYGIHAAELAGVPRIAVQRAREILTALESGEEVAPRVLLDGADEPIAKGGVRTKRGARLRAEPLPWEPQQLSLFDQGTHPVVERLQATDLNRLTPIEALTLLAELKREAGG